MIRRPIRVVRTSDRVPGTNAGPSSLLSGLERGSNQVGPSDMLTSRRVEQALAALATVAEPDARQEMKLLAALGASRLYTRGGVPEVASAWTKALELAKSLGDLEYQKRSLWGLWSFHVNGVDYRTALSLAHRFASLVATSLDPEDRFVGERITSTANSAESAQDPLSAWLPAQLIGLFSPTRSWRCSFCTIGLHVEAPSRPQRGSPTHSLSGNRQPEKT